MSNRVNRMVAAILLLMMIVTGSALAQETARKKGGKGKKKAAPTRRVRTPEEIAAEEAKLLAETAPKRDIAPGKFEPSYKSLQQYQTPEWFRDAKFGIWAHWTAQCVPQEGDWYAQKMYLEGSPDYVYHLAHYGHPSVFGFKDIDNLWKVDKWEPGKLIEMYKAAGAKYFVALGNHHDNLDCWNSKFQPWNSVNVGPKKDLVGEWAKAARANGMHFGVTVHAARAWSWYEAAQGADTQGEKAGVPYDGKLTKADGKGKWWEGLDPQELYAQNHKPGDKPDQAYIDKFFNRVKDLIDSYDPDLLYFDDTHLPLGEAGLNIGAHYYNHNMATHGGKLEAVLNTKNLGPELRKTMVWDIERGKAQGIEPFVWQTDTCIGSWHYNRHTRDDNKYKTVDQVVDMLIDIVSKNGNLLLNIPVRGDGTIDDTEVAFLKGMAVWMKVNEEGIFGTRPWKVYGEGAAKLEGGRFGGETDTGKYTAEDVRFTTKGEALYAFVLAAPTGEIKIRALGKKAATQPGEIAGIKLLGGEGKVAFAQGDDALTIQAPAKSPCPEAICYQLTFKK